MKKIILALSIGLLPRTVLAQEAVSWNVNASTVNARLGEPLTISGTLISNGNQRWNFDLAASTADSYAIVAVKMKNAKINDGHKEQRFNLTILPLAIGRVSLTLAWSSPDQKQPRFFRSPAFVFEVPAPDIPKNARPNDIKAPRSARPPLWPWLVLAALLAVGYFLGKKLLRQKLPGPTPSALDMRPPEIIAESELEILRNSKLWENAKYKDFYTILTDILRRYLARRFDVSAPRMTTSELCRRLRQAGMESSALSLAKETLERADIVKFAKILPDPGWGARDINAGSDIVHRTTPLSNPERQK
ncbi:MAG: hypothetical protein ACYCPQ_04390 [Elusimicrobiota bacterium]